MADEVEQAADGAPAAIRLAGVSRTYGDPTHAVHALRQVDLELPAGSLSVLLGPSGSGKTTLLNVIGALEAPTSGTVVVDGQDLTTLDEPARTAFRADAVGFVFQFFHLVPTLTARENIELVLELTGRDDPAGRARRALDDVDLAGEADRRPGELSGGEQQRVAIARAIAQEPRILLCDEPTGALDLQTGQRVLEVLRRVNRERGCTVLLVTHNAAIARMADRVIRMRSGRVVSHDVTERPIEGLEVIW